MVLRTRFAFPHVELTMMVIHVRLMVQAYGLCSILQIEVERSDEVKLKLRRRFAPTAGQNETTAKGSEVCLS